MSWFDLLKNIQIAGQRTSSKNYVKPDNEDEDCFKYFYDLVKLLHPDFELKRQNYPNDIQSEDYWCRVKDTGWRQFAYSPENESWGIGMDVIEDEYNELMIYYHKAGYHGDNYTALSIQIPESYVPNHIKQQFIVYGGVSEINYDNVSVDSSNARRVDNVAEIWKKVIQHMGDL
tara:strand:+ start:648 stop:1169 length:522 start_codon:yes stop_codon:yes gene_type:complete